MRVTKSQDPKGGTFSAQARIGAGGAFWDPPPEARRLDCGVRRSLAEGGGAVKGVHEEPGGRVQGGEALEEAREALTEGERESR